MTTLMTVLKWECAVIAVVIFPVITGMVLFGLYKMVREE